MSADVPSNVISDEMRLVQVLANLFNNAIKFTEKGQITLTIEALSVADTVAQLRFRVSDTGIGIASHNQSHLFNAFSQADESMTRKYGGSGLGLSICQQIIKLLGGKISLVSELGHGSELSFVLPFQRVQLDTPELISNLPAELNQPLLSDISIYTTSQKLSTSFIESIAKMNWVLHIVGSVEELCQLDIAVNSVLLIGEDDFIQQQNHPELTVPLAKFRLLCLCQPALRQLNNDTCNYLDKLTTSYLLVDMPLFRYALDQISKALLYDVEHSELQGNNLNVRVGSYPENLGQILHDTERNNRQESLVIREEGSLQGISILLVEDNLVNQLVAKELLLNMSAKVIIADNGQRALDTLAEHHFDVILMDIQMPIMDGLTAAKHIRAQDKYQDLPIIAMTAHAREEDKQQSLSSGMNLHMSKPVTGKVLLNSIKQVLSKLKT
jgi:CheY-like chemotaxis protein